jgi:hypothetical protein
MQTCIITCNACASCSLLAAVCAVRHSHIHICALFSPFPLCAPVGGKCAPDAHWRRVALARNAAAPLCLAVVFVFRCGMAPARACGYFYPLGMAAHGHVKALRRKVALEIRRWKVVA